MKPPIQTRRQIVPGMFSREFANSDDKKNASSTQKISGEQSQDCNFKVVIRVRPPLQREICPNIPFQSSVPLQPLKQILDSSFS